MQKKSTGYNNEEWEKICTNCGRCCLIKIQDDETDEIFYTNVVCRYFDIKTRKCKEYENRCTLVPECLKLTPDNVDKISWMPKKCAYRSLFEDSFKADKSNISSFCISETKVNEEDLEDYIIDEQ